MFNAHVVHSVPFLSVLTNHCMMANDGLRMHAKHYFIFLPIMIAYSGVNYFGQWFYGSPIYWFLDWNQLLAYGLVLVLSLVFFALHFCVSKLCECCRGKSKPE